MIDVKLKSAPYPSEFKLSH